MKVIKRHWLILLFLLFYLIIIGYKLIFHPVPFYDWDEAIYVQVGKEMMEKKSLIPTWQGKYWLDKPPLVMLIYGSVNKLSVLGKPEVIDRIFNLLLVVVTYIFIYLFYLKVINDKLLIGLAVFLSSFTPLFLQRAHQINFDVFLLLGWLGYLLFFDKFLISLFFLSLSVLTKSLVGFYPVVMVSFYYLFLFWRKKIRLKQFKNLLSKIILQVTILSLWYVIMFVIFGKKFWQQHFVESHFKRVSSSIESHFGKKTFYIDLLFEQFSFYPWLSFLGFFYFGYQFIKKRISEKQFFYGLYFLPWFIFLNLTKTKIFWYIYPSIPVFAFLAVYSLNAFKKKRVVVYLLTVLILITVINRALVEEKFLTSQYSSFNNYYYLAKEAKNHCFKLYYLVDKDSRQAMRTLEEMGLTITTTKWWGNHPSVVYYFGKKVDFVYNKERLTKNLLKLEKNSCLGLEKGDFTTDFPANYFQKINQFNSLFLFKKI